MIVDSMTDSAAVPFSIRAGAFGKGLVEAFFPMAWVVMITLDSGRAHPLLWIAMPAIAVLGLAIRFWDKSWKNEQLGGVDIQTRTLQRYEYLGEVACCGATLLILILNYPGR